MYDIAVIGAGPAGASAALFAAKAGKNTLLIHNDKSMISEMNGKRYVDHDILKLLNKN